MGCSPLGRHCEEPQATRQPRAAHGATGLLRCARNDAHKKGGPKPAFYIYAASLLAPDFLCDLHNQSQLRPLFFLGERVALLSGSKAALR